MNNKGKKVIKDSRRPNVMERAYDTNHYKPYVARDDGSEGPTGEPEVVYRSIFAIYEDMLLVMMCQMTI